MTSWNRERGLGSACVLVGLVVGCSGATFTSSGKDAGSAGMAVTGGSSGTSASGGKGGGGGKGATGGAGGTEAGSDGSGATGGSDATGGTSGSATGGNGSGGGGNGGTGGSTGGTTGGTSATGGDSGTAGTGGTSGAGGSAGMSACITGESCAMEGDHCSEGGCCPCQHTCTEGKWSQPICPPCAAPICPLNPPNDGDPCSACDLTLGLCDWDRCSAENTQYSGQCEDGTWKVSATTCGDPTCCDSDEQCASGICVETMCEPEAPGGCWRDDDCGNGEFCSGVFVCGCNAACSSRDYPGTCVPEGKDCCRDDTDCPSSEQCVAGACKEPETAGCWSDRDCGDGVCEGESVCPCGAMCTKPDSPGVCVTPI